MIIRHSTAKSSVKAAPCITKEITGGGRERCLLTILVTKDSPNARRCMVEVWSSKTKLPFAVRLSRTNSPSGLESAERFGDDVYRGMLRDFKSQGTVPSVTREKRWAIRCGWEMPLPTWLTAWHKPTYATLNFGTAPLYKKTRNEAKRQIESTRRQVCELLVTATDYSTVVGTLPQCLIRPRSKVLFACQRTNIIWRFIAEFCSLAGFPTYSYRMAEHGHFWEVNVSGRTDARFTVFY